MLKKATAHIPNVELLDGSEYVISQLSFPSYFIKKQMRFLNHRPR